LRAEKYDWRPYYFAAGDFNIALSTPPWITGSRRRGGCRPSAEHKKRNKKQQSADENAGNSGEPKEWEEEAGAHPAVFGIYAMPKGQGRVGIGVGPLVQRKLGCKTKVQD